MSEHVKEIGAWREKTGLSFILAPENDPLKNALQLKDLKNMPLYKLDDVINILSSWHVYLASEMGIIYARVNYTGSKAERAKLDMIKPVHDAIKVKIDALKKIYDRKVKEALNRSNNG